MKIAEVFSVSVEGITNDRCVSGRSVRINEETCKAANVTVKADG